MERISQADVTTALERLHQELKSQTRDSKTDQHHLLRKAFHYVTATLYKPLQAAPTSGGRKATEVTHKVLQELFALLVGGDGFAPPRIRLLSSALVRELSAGETPYFFRDNYGGDFSHYDHNKVKYFLPILSELSCATLLTQNAHNLVNWFVSDKTLLSLKMTSLSNLVSLIQRFPGALDKDKHIRPVEKQFIQILTAASLETRKTMSTTLFGVNILSTSAPCNVTEIDGTPSRDIFTCMNNSYDYSEDQVLNVHVFSFLYYWIFHLYQSELIKARRKQSRDDIVWKLEHFGLAQPPESDDEANDPYEVDASLDINQNKEVNLDDKSPQDSRSGEKSGQRREKMQRFALDVEFREVVISVCLRILTQVERDIVTVNVSQLRLGSKYVICESDWMRELTEATSMEAVRILDLICLMDPSLVTRIFPAVKKVYERTANKQSGIVFSAVLQFFVNHGQHVIFDVDPVLHHFCVDYVSVRYRRQLLAMSTLLFLTTNTSKMLLHTPVFPKYFPAILKLLAWHPRTVAAEILPLIPAMVGPTTFAELFHTLLDLPLTTAFMEHYDRPEEFIAESSGKVGLDRNSPAFKSVQQYIMRTESGIKGVCVWDNRDETQLAMIRTLWNSLPVTPRVSSVCKLVPRFLRVYMDVLLNHAPSRCIERIVPLLLQRYSSLYPVDFYLGAVQALIIDTLHAIFQQWPSFLMSLRNEVVGAISAHMDSQGHSLVLHLCWIVGELTSPATAGLDSMGEIGVFFEALEFLAYESIPSRADDTGEKKRRAFRSMQAGASKVDADQNPVSNITIVEAIKSLGEERPFAEEPLTAAGSDQDDSNAASRPDGAEDESADQGSRLELQDREKGSAAFAPRLVVVIIAALTKLGTKFPEFAPRVILCLLKMKHHYEEDFSEGVEFVRDRLVDSLQLLRHSSIVNSIFCSHPSASSLNNLYCSVHQSSLTSLCHISHSPAAFTRGGHLHDFELPTHPPLADAFDVHNKLGLGPELVEVSERSTPDTPQGVDATSGNRRFKDFRRASSAAQGGTPPRSSVPVAWSPHREDKDARAASGGHLLEQPQPVLAGWRRLPSDVEGGEQLPVNRLAGLLSSAVLTGQDTVPSPVDAQGPQTEPASFQTSSSTHTGPPWETATTNTSKKDSEMRVAAHTPRHPVDLVSSVKKNSSVDALSSFDAQSLPWGRAQNSAGTPLAQAIIGGSEPSAAAALSETVEDPAEAGLTAKNTTVVDTAGRLDIAKVKRACNSDEDASLQVEDRRQPAVAVGPSEASAQVLESWITPRVSAPVHAASKAPVLAAGYGPSWPSGIGVFEDAGVRPFGVFEDAGMRRFQTVASPVTSHKSDSPGYGQKGSCEAGAVQTAAGSGPDTASSAEPRIPIGEADSVKHVKHLQAAFKRASEDGQIEDEPMLASVLGRINTVSLDDNQAEATTRVNVETPNSIRRNSSAPAFASVDSAAGHDTQDCEKTGNSPTRNPSS